MVYRVYVEKKPQFANEAKGILKEAKELLQIEGLDSVRVINRYDVENLSEELFENAVGTVFSEPQVDNVYRELKADPSEKVFVIEYLPGQFDARANSAAECIQLISRGDRPTVKTAKVFILSGPISDEDVNRLKKYIINPVEAREASLEKIDTLKVNVEIPTTVETLTGFNAYTGEQLQEFLTSHGLAMDLADLAFVQEYFKKEQRDPTITEIRVIDTYW